MDKENRQAEIKEKLSTYEYDNQIIVDLVGEFMHTFGIKYFADECDAHDLITVVGTECRELDDEGRIIQVSISCKDRNLVVSYFDTKGIELRQKEYEVDYCVIDVAELYFIANRLMLQSEYESLKVTEA